jgi:hypothetical protein
VLLESLGIKPHFACAVAMLQNHDYILIWDPVQVSVMFAIRVNLVRLATFPGVRAKSKQISSFNFPFLGWAAPAEMPFLVWKRPIPRLLLEGPPSLFFFLRLGSMPSFFLPPLLWVAVVAAHCWQQEQ